MEEASNFISTKRRSSDSLFTGTFTRSKSQIYLHFNRSGRTRSDSFRRRDNIREPQFQSPSKRPRLRGRFPVKKDEDQSRNLIKDLRTRRVFSPVAASCEFCVDGDGEKGTKGSPKGSENLEGGCCFFARESRNLNDVKVVESDGGYWDKEQKMEELSAGDEECLQGTPPDAEIIGCRSENDGDKEGLLLRNSQHVSRDPSIGKKMGNNLATKFAFRPCSRVKVFKAPGSLSYRRLLPFLMDMAKENSSALRKGDCSNIEDQKGDSLFVDGDPETMSQGIAVVANGSSDVSDSKLASVEQTADTSTPFDSQRESCIMLCLPTSEVDEGSLKALVNERNENMEICDSLKDDNLNVPDYSSSLEDLQFNECSNDAKPEEIQANITTNTEFSCNAMDINDRAHNLSLAAEEHQICNHIEVDQQADEKIQMDSEAVKALDIMQSLPTLSSAKENGRTYKLQKKNNDGDGNVSDKSDDSKKECIQMTPPDPEIFGKPDIYEDLNNRTKCVLLKDDQGPQETLEGSIHRTNSGECAKKMDSNTKSKLGLNSCSRLKLFKTPNSFGYRRLLPFLMDISRDNYGSSPSRHFHRFEEKKEQNQLSTSSPSDFGTPMEMLNDRRCDMEPKTDHSSPPQIAILAAANQATGGDQANLVSAENNFETALSFDLKEEQESQATEIKSNKDKQLMAASDTVNSIHGSGLLTTKSCPDVSSKSFPFADLKFPQKFSTDSEGAIVISARRASDTKPVEVGILSQKSLQLVSSDPFKIPAHGSTKGILKRNPRGCRGVCGCLNCASFRLHAEKAFEFSKNQMQDTEEMALDLIKELSHLRNLLEKSAFDSDASHNEMREACRKASQAEEKAKDRLNQMNYDLNVHCRITCGQRPRVTFSNDVKERVVPLANFPSNDLKL